MAIVLVIALVCVCIAVIAGSEEYRRAMLAQETSDDAPGDWPNCNDLIASFHAPETDA